MTGTVLALECPSSLRKFIPFCEARRRENPARLQCWEGAALENYRKCESNRAPRRNSTPRGARSRSERITQETDSLGRRFKRFAHLRFRRTRPESMENTFFAGSPKRFAHFRFRRTGPENFQCGFFQEVLGGLRIFGSVELDPKSFFGRSPMRFGNFRIGR